MRLSRPLATLVAVATLTTGAVALPTTALAATRGGAVQVRGTDPGADHPDPRIRRFELHGVIRTVDPDLHTVTVTVLVKRHRERSTRQVSLVLANNAWVRVNGAAATQADLEEGDRVEIGGVVLSHDDGTPWLLGLRVRAKGVRDLPPDTGTD